MMNQENIKNLLIFLDRVEVKGLVEVEAMQKIVDEIRKLNENVVK